jgi:hypothetical protein
MEQGFIFGIGLGGTGTRTLNRCLEMLGRRSIHAPSAALMSAGRFAEALAGRDAATGIAVAAYFDVLDRKYPGSRFILTTRDLAPWLDSIESGGVRGGPGAAEPDGPEAAVRAKVYGSGGCDRKTLARAYDTHLARVRAHFGRRPGDLLEIDVYGRGEWGDLCAFLRVDVPEAPFPRINRSAA